MMWHYQINHQERGPVTQAGIEKLISGGLIQAPTLVKRQNMNDWLPASDTELGWLFYEQAGMVAPSENRIANAAAVVGKGSTYGLACLGFMVSSCIVLAMLVIGTAFFIAWLTAPDSTGKKPLKPQPATHSPAK
jgi:hypothetical protein